MPADIVKTCLDVYYGKYMSQTLSAMTRATDMKLDAHVKVRGKVFGYEKSHILVSFNAPRHASILSANTLKRLDDDSFCGIITVNPELLEYEPTFRKFTLAEEWIEIMVGFRDKGLRRQRVKDRIFLMMIYDSLIHVAPWQDSQEDEREIHSALRKLLIPLEHLDQLAQSIHGFSLKDVPNMIETDRQRTGHRLRDLAKHASMRWSVEYRWVTSRIMEFLADGRSD